MDRIYYVGNSVLTGSAIAAALLRYAVALSARQQAGTVAIPVRLENGEQARTTFLVGPASQMTSDAEASDFEEITDLVLEAHLNEAIAKLQVPARRSVALAVSGKPDTSLFDDYYDL